MPTDRTPPFDPASGQSPADPSAPEPVASAGDPAQPREFSRVVAAITEDELRPPARRRLLRQVVREEFRERGVRALFRPKAAIRWITDAVTDVAPHIPVRDLDTLRRHYDGLDGEALAERLVRNASRITSGIGAAGGGVAAIEWVATPTLLSAPVLLAAETVAIVAVELKLIGELHEVYRQPIAGTGTARAGALIQAWARRRGVNPLVPGGGGVAVVLGTATRKELRDRLLRRFGRNLTTLGPVLTGAAVAGVLNRRATMALGREVRRDLRYRTLPPATKSGPAT